MGSGRGILEKRRGGTDTVSKGTKRFKRQGWVTVLKAAKSRVKMETSPLGGPQSCCGDFGRNISVVCSEERPDGSRVRREQEVSKWRQLLQEGCVSGEVTGVHAWWRRIDCFENESDLSTVIKDLVVKGEVGDTGGRQEGRQVELRGEASPGPVVHKPGYPY